MLSSVTNPRLVSFPLEVTKTFLPFAVLVVLFCANSMAARKCTKSCTLDYTPVCAGPETGADKPISFGNECVLANFNCENNKSE